jgi:AcrR family transcriptional regulator
MGGLERREREKQARRETILATARKLFDERGFEATTIDDIAAAAEFSKGTIYYYFPSKIEILGILQLENMRVLEQWFVEATAGVDDPVERLTRIGEAYGRYVRERLNLSRMVYLLHENFDASLCSEPLRAELASGLARLFGHVHQALSDGMTRGLFRADIDPAKTAFVFWGAAIGIHSLGIKMGELFPFTADEVTDELIKMIPRGLSGSL